LRKPESGAAVSRDRLIATRRLARRTPSRGGNLVGVGSSARALDGREDVTTLEGIDCRRS
jgi:hypothetical protein